MYGIPGGGKKIKKMQIGNHLIKKNE